MSIIKIDARLICDDDCIPEGCPGHNAVLEYNSVTNRYNYINDQIECGGFTLDSNAAQVLIEMFKKLSEHRKDTIKVEFESKTGFLIKKPVIDLRELDKNYLIKLILKNGKEYTGIFIRIDTDDEIILRLFDDPNKCLGIDLFHVKEFYLGPELTQSFKINPAN